jgi:lipopolysaccharide/colanic/teichoic acid biosynthesis glycosyltransferase
MFKRIVDAILNNENLLAVILALVMILLVILTADTSPTWIYQGF